MNIGPLAARQQKYLKKNSKSGQRYHSRITAHNARSLAFFLNQFKKTTDIPVLIS